MDKKNMFVALIQVRLNLRSCLIEQEEEEL